MRERSDQRPAERDRDSGAVWASLQRRLRAFIASRLREPADADDVLQEVFLRIHRGLAGLEATARLDAWVYQITRNAIADHYRGRAARRDAPAGDMAELDRLAAADPRPAARPETAGSGEARELLAGCLAPLMERLSAQDRSALTLTEGRGLTQREAAQRLGVSLSGMKSRVQRARGRLRTLLLDCCHVDLDRSGRISGYQPRSGPVCTLCGRPPMR